jgi:hypothetical protein
LTDRAEQIKPRISLAFVKKKRAGQEGKTVRAKQLSRRKLLSIMSKELYHPRDFLQACRCFLPAGKKNFPSLAGCSSTAAEASLLISIDLRLCLSKNGLNKGEPLWNIAHPANAKRKRCHDWKGLQPKSGKRNHSPLPVGHHALLSQHQSAKRLTWQLGELLAGLVQKDAHVVVPPCRTSEMVSGFPRHRSEIRTSGIADYLPDIGLQHGASQYQLTANCGFTAIGQD